MNSQQIEAILYKSKYTKHLFLGCHPFDHIDKCLFKSKKLKILIFNTDISGGPGQHWFLVLLRNNHCEIYDSLHFVTPNIKIKRREPFRVQSLTSNACGAHTVLLALLYAIKVPRADIYKHVYRKDQFSYNDALAKRFTRHYAKTLFR